MGKIGKRLKSARDAFADKENVSVEEAVDLIKANANAKFDETVEISMNLGVDPRHADQMVRGTVNLPNGTGKTVRVAVFARGPKAEEAKEAGADIVGAEDLMDTVQGGTIEFDRCIATFQRIQERSELLHGGLIDPSSSTVGTVGQNPTLRGKQCRPSPANQCPKWQDNKSHEYRQRLRHNLQWT